MCALERETSEGVFAMPESSGDEGRLTDPVALARTYRTGHPEENENFFSFDIGVAPAFSVSPAHVL